MFTLAHLSDLHLTTLADVRLRALAGKRAFGYVSWRLKRRARHRPEIVAALVEDLARTRPDHIAITGDLTHIGLPTEFAQAAAWLGAAGSPQWITLIPGNHDAYGPAKWQETFARWESYMQSDASEQAGPDMFPTLRVRGPAALIGLSTANPSPLFAATGSLGQRQIEALETLLLETKRRGLFRVVLMHHPPLPHLVSWRRALTDAERLRGAVQRCGAELILHGHTHRTSFGALPGPQQPVPVAGVRSGSEIGHKPGRRAQYHLYTITPCSSGWTVQLTVRSLMRDVLRFSSDAEPGL